MDLILKLQTEIRLLLYRISKETMKVVRVQLDLLSVGPPSELARFSFAPRSRFLLLVFQLRIIVPDPLRVRRLAAAYNRDRTWTLRCAWSPV
jgi:hypothetical protein